MTIEFLKARVEGKAKEIAKLEKKLSRIEAAKATNWNTNPYYYSESDLKWTERDLEKARASLVEYSDKLLAEIEKKSYEPDEYTELFRAQDFDAAEIEKALYVYGAFCRLVGNSFDNLLH